jgi:hypothetical protein
MQILVLILMAWLVAWSACSVAVPLTKEEVVAFFGMEHLQRWRFLTVAGFLWVMTVLVLPFTAFHMAAAPLEGKKMVGRGVAAVGLFMTLLLTAHGMAQSVRERLGEFAVLAPATPPEGAVKMAQRLSQIVEAAGPRPAGVPPLRVRAGYEAVRDLHATPLEPVSLLTHARTALHQAIATGNGERIRAYRA